MSDKKDHVKEWLLEQYTEKPVRMFVQLEGMQHEFMTATGLELRDSNLPVRVQIAMGATKEEVLATLKEMYLSLYHDWPDMEVAEHYCRGRVNEEVKAFRGEQLLNAFTESLSADDKEAVEWVLGGRDNDIPF